MIFEFKGQYYRRMKQRDMRYPNHFGDRAKIISLGPLSPNALRVYKNLITGKFYRPHSDRCPKAMAELVEAGLVGTVGRVVTVERCYVPHHGYTAYQPEKFEE